MAVAGLGFVPCEQLEDRPHLMVDGASRPSSVLTLSHWPSTPTPPVLWRDLSAESVLAYLRAATDGVTAQRVTAQAAGASAELSAALEAGASAEAVTNDHFDEDGLVSVFAAVAPESALGVAELLVDVASCGDFGVVRSDEAAQVAFALLGLAEAEAGLGAGTGERYLAVLPRVAELLGHPERFRSFWADEFAAFALGRDALRSGAVEIEAVPGLDFAVVRRGDGPPGTVGVAEMSGRLPGASGGLPIHAAAVHSATPATRLLAFDGDFCELYLRYEGWVRYVSRAVALRPDLAPLALELSSLEPGPGGVEWEANAVGAIVGRLRPSGDGRTNIAPELVRSTVERYLARAKPTWDPFRPGGGYIPPAERRRYLAAVAGRAGAAGGVGGAAAESFGRPAPAPREDGAPRMTSQAMRDGSGHPRPRHCRGPTSLAHAVR